MALRWSLDEVENVAFFLLSDFRLCHVLENATKRVTQLAVVTVAPKRLDRDFVKAPLVEKGPGLITRKTVLHGVVLDNGVEDDCHTGVLH